MDHLVKFITKIDQNGAPLRIAIEKDIFEYKSLFGGLTTLVLYSLSLTYFIYGIVQWFTNQSSPIITTSQQSNERSKIQIPNLQDYSLFNFASENKIISCFDKENLVLMILLFELNGVDQPKFLQRLEINNEAINLKNNTFYRNYINEQGIVQDNQLMLIFTDCDTNLLNEDEICANQTTREAFWRQVNFMKFTQHFQMFDHQQRQIQSMERTIYSIYTNQQTLFMQGVLKIQETEVDNGILFSQISTYQFISDFTFQTQSGPMELYKSMFERNAYLIVTLKLDSIMNKQIIQYPKINQVLADIGSIIQIILFLNFVAIKWNQSLYEKDLQDRILKIYFPQIDFSKQSISIQKIQKHCVEKISLVNLVYEISRLQFGMQKLMDRDKISELHQLGIEFNQQDNPQDNKINQNQEDSNLNSLSQEMQESICKLTILKSQ
ncbi:hypothetical protein pb186bvf_020600, partial [Paramecium bursaria]